MKTRTIDIKANTELGKYFSDLTVKSKNLRNVANYYIRNTMTGIKKSPEERTSNEVQVLNDVFTGIQMANDHTDARFLKTVQKAKNSEEPSLTKHATIYRKLNSLKYLKFPTEEHWFLDYSQLDAIFKFTKNQDYYALPSQVNQQAIKKTVEAWKAYFKTLKLYNENPGAFNSKPRIPKYIKTAETTAHITNQRIKDVSTGTKREILLPDTKMTMCIGDADFQEDIVKVEIKPWCRNYRVCITYGKDEEPQPITTLPSPKRILGLDPGVANFLTGTFNFAETPFIIDGKWLKSENQWFNKRRAHLLSALTKGMDSTHSIKNSKQLDALSQKRFNKIDDFFYKAAYWICRLCISHGVDAIVVGHNNRQKQYVNHGAINNQNFIGIPYTRFNNILTYVAGCYDISVIIREESYTSQASLIDGDFIPTYGKDKVIPVFSGKRVKRGKYISKDGTVLNADVNSAGNIARKEYQDAFKDIEDWKFLYKTIRVVTRNELCGSKHL